MTDRRALCLDQVMLTPREKSLLRGLHAAEPDEDQLRCGLEAGHGCEHAARAHDQAIPGDPQRWLRWWPGRRVLEAAASCGTLSEDALTSCVIVAGHEGRHSFDLAAPPERTSAAVAS